MADLKTLKKMVKALNKLDLLEDEIEIRKVEEDELRESFIQAIEEIDDNGQTKEVDDEILDFYEDLLDEEESGKKEEEEPKKGKKGKKGKKAKKGKKGKKEKKEPDFDEDALREELEDMDMDELEEYIEDNDIKVKVKKKDEEDDVIEKIIEACRPAEEEEEEEEEEKPKTKKGKKAKKEKKAKKGKKGKKGKKKKKSASIDEAIESLVEDGIAISELVSGVAEELNIDEKKAQRQVLKAIVEMDVTVTVD